MTARNGYEEAARQRKVARFVAAFDKTIIDAGNDPQSPEAAAVAMRQLMDATPEQWAMLAEQLGEPVDPRSKKAKIPSETTRREIVAHYAEIANRLHAIGDRDDQEPGRERYGAEGEVNGRAYAVTATNDYGRGFTWSVRVGGVFLRGGYSRGVDVRDAFEAGRACFAEHLNSSQEVA